MMESRTGVNTGVKIIESFMNDHEENSSDNADQIKRRKDGVNSSLNSN